jgi:HTH-type transcriptional regulator/antitoxin PezA
VSIGDRIKKARQGLNMTQQAFADKIGLKRNTVATYEMDRAQPSDRTIADICREFNVNESWLRTGEGDMFLRLSRDEELAAFFGDVLSGQPDFKRRFLAVLARLDEKEWGLLEQMADRLVREMQAEKEGQD